MADIVSGGTNMVKLADPLGDGEQSCEAIRRTGPQAHPCLFLRGPEYALCSVTPKFLDRVPLALLVFAWELTGARDALTEPVATQFLVLCPN